MTKETKQLLAEWVKTIPELKLKPSVEITYDEEYGHGLRIKDFQCEQANDEDEIPILSVPKNYVICASRIKELAVEDPLLKSWIDVDSCTGTDLLHRGLLYYWIFKDSDWKPYLKALPTDLDLPFNYSIKRMESLDFATVSVNYAAISKRLVIERFYERFVTSNVKHSKSISLKEWLLPYQWISSRGLKHPVKDEVCIVPIVDLCNHSSVKSNVRYDVDGRDNFLLLLTPANLPDGASSDLLLNYGLRSSSEFMFNYGFIPEDRTENDFDEIIRFFDPHSDEIRDLLDPGRFTESADEEQRFAWSLAYDVLLEFFADSIPQKLHIVILPKSVEADESKRFRFHNHFIMALASDEHLELVVENKSRVLYLDNIKLEPDSVFDAVQAINDMEVISKARQLVAKLCQSFYKDLIQVSDTDAAISKLAKVEASIYKRYAEAIEMQNS